MAHPVPDYEVVSIFNIPSFFYMRHRSAREPRVLTIGPAFVSLPSMPESFLFYKKLLRTQLLAGPHPTNLTNITAIARASATRQCYEGAFQNNLQPDDLVTDSLWLAAWLYSELEKRFALGWFFNFFQRKGLRGLMHMMPTDIVLLENQLPMPLLAEAVEILSNRCYHKIQFVFQKNQASSKVHMLLLNVLPFLSPFRDTQIHDPSSMVRELVWDEDIMEEWRLNLYEAKHLNMPIGVDDDHLLDYAYRKVCGNQPKENFSTHEPIIIPSASALISLGFQFKSFEWGEWEGQDDMERKGSSRGKIIELKGQTLYLPSVKMYEDLLPKLMSFLVYESMAKDTYFLRSFMHVMNCLVVNTRDVEVLRNAEVIKWGITESAAAFFSTGTENLQICLLKSIETALKDVKKICETKWRVMLGSVYHRFFHSRQPWLFFGFVSAVVLLTLTCVQTAFSIKSYDKQ